MADVSYILEGAFVNFLLPVLVVVDAVNISQI